MDYNSIMEESNKPTGSRPAGGSSNQQSAQPKQDEHEGHDHDGEMDHKDGEMDYKDGEFDTSDGGKTADGEFDDKFDTSDDGKTADGEFDRRKLIYIRDKAGNKRSLNEKGRILFSEMRRVLAQRS